jgi:hypothetical protein
LIFIECNNGLLADRLTIISCKSNTNINPHSPLQVTLAAQSAVILCLVAENETKSLVHYRDAEMRENDPYLEDIGKERRFWWILIFLEIYDLLSRNMIEKFIYPSTERKKGDVNGLEYQKDSLLVGDSIGSAFHSPFVYPPPLHVSRKRFSSKRASYHHRSKYSSSSS